MTRSAVAILAVACMPGGAGAATLDIVFEVPQTPSDSQREVLSAAEAYWEGLVPGYRDGVVIDALTIEVGAYDGDGPGAVLADSSPLDLVEAAGFTLPTSGFIDFDFADLAPLEDADQLFSVLVHEVAHVLGFGTLWIENDVYEPGSGAYTGSNALATYRAEFDPLAAIIPVELGFGPGTEDSHWAETWAGGFDELMTGFADPPEYLSDTTLASFRDLGYVTVDVVVPAPVPLPGGVWLGLGAFGILAALGRRRTA